MKKLTVSRALLNPAFNGYKLAHPSGATRMTEQSISHAFQPLPLHVDTSRHVALPFVTLFAAHNHLYKDPFDSTRVYTVDRQLNVLAIDVASLTLAACATLPLDPSERASTAAQRDALPPSVCFPSADLALASPGNGVLVLFAKTTPLWQQRASCNLASLLLADLKFVIRCAHFSSSDQLIRCVLQSLEESPQRTPGRKLPACLVRLHHVTLRASPSGGSLDVVSTSGPFTTASLPPFVALRSNGQQLLVLADKPVSLAAKPTPANDAKDAKDANDANDAPTASPDPSDSSSSSTAPFQWSQTASDVTIRIPVPPDTTAQSIRCRFTRSTLHVETRTTDAAHPTLTLAGPLFDEIDEDGSAWSLERTSRPSVSATLEITLAKASESRMTWPHLLASGTLRSVPPTLSEDQRRAALDSLEKYTSELNDEEEQAYRKFGLGFDSSQASERFQRNLSEARQILPQLQSRGEAISISSSTGASAAAVDSTDASVGFGFSHDVEDCDFDEGGNLVLHVFDTTSGQLADAWSTSSSQWLLNATEVGTTAPSFAVRYDVDAPLFATVSPAVEGAPPVQHLATFNALGYVQASKREKKFMSCAADASFAVICEGSRHLFVFHQPRPRSAQPQQQGPHLSGFVPPTQQSDTAPQLVQTLSSESQVLGMQILGTQHVIVLTEDSLAVVTL